MFKLFPLTFSACTRRKQWLAGALPLSFAVVVLSSATAQTVTTDGPSFAPLKLTHRGGGDSGSSSGGSTSSSSGSSSSGSSSITGSSSSTASGTAVGSPLDITQSGSYYLTNNVTCTTTCFSIDANNVTLNLNGYTVTFGSPSTVMAAFSLCDAWYTGSGEACTGNGQHQNVEVYGGKVVEASNAAPFTPVFLIGEANGLNGGKLHDLVASFGGTGSQFIQGNFPGIGWQIYNNTINDTVTNIQKSGQGPLSARSQFQGQVIWLNNTNNAPGAGNLIYDNIINGSPQGGIYDTDQNTQIYGNTITLSSYYSNDYGVTDLADRQQVHDNTINGRGRGLDGEASNFVFNHNTINVHEEANNSEYGGCELGGSDGIRVKNYGGTPTSGAVISNNAVTVGGQYCEANGIALSQLVGVKLTIENNTFTTVAGTTAGADAAGNGYYPIRYDQVENNNITWTNNTFTGDGVYIYWDGANTSIQSGQTWHLRSPQVYAIDGGQSITGFPEALTIEDSLSNPSAFCGSYSSALLKIGSYQEQCN